MLAFTLIMYAIAKKVAIPARISVKNRDPDRDLTCEEVSEIPSKPTHILTCPEPSKRNLRPTMLPATVSLILVKMAIFSVSVNYRFSIARGYVVWFTTSEVKSLRLCTSNHQRSVARKQFTSRYSNLLIFYKSSLPSIKKSRQAA